MRPYQRHAHAAVVTVVNARLLVQPTTHASLRAPRQRVQELQHGADHLGIVRTLVQRLAHNVKRTGESGRDTRFTHAQQVEEHLELSLGGAFAHDAARFPEHRDDLALRLVLPSRLRSRRP